MRNIRLFAVGMVIVLIFTSSCSSSKKSGTDSHELYEPESVVPDTFVFPQVPASLTDPDERAQYLIHHFWDRFDFADSMLTKKPAITEQAFVDYIHLLRFLPNEESAEVLRHTLKRAEANSSMFRYFVSLNISMIPTLLFETRSITSLCCKRQSVPPCWRRLIALVTSSSWRWPCRTVWA